MNTKQQGDIGVAKAIYFYTALGYTVSIPNTDNAKYDLIIDNGQLYRVQVKTTTYRTKHGVYQAMLRTSGGNQSWSGEVGRINEDKVDIVAIISEDGNFYQYPAKILHGRTTVNLGKDSEEYKVALDRW